jgi:hypothetical protein
MGNAVHLLDGWVGETVPRVRLLQSSLVQPSRGLQAGLICGVGALFFLATVLSQGGAISNGTATAILAGACVAVLAGILLVVRRARLSGLPPAAEQATPRRTAGVVRTTGFVLGIVLIELTQVASLPEWVRVTAGLCGALAIVWGIVALRRSRRG